MSNLEIIGILFIFWGVIVLLLTLVRTKPLKLQAILFINVFFAIIYGFTPGAILLYVADTGDISFPLNQINFTGDEITYIYYFLISSIVVFFGINFGYRIKQKQKENKISITVNGVHVSAFLLLIIGMASLLIWTSAYGGPIGILPYANALRAGRDVGINNPFSFLMKLCPFMQFASYVFFSYYLSYKKRSDLLFFIISGIGSFLYILANSSRLHFVLYFVILFALYSGHEKITRKTIILFALLSVAAISIMHISEELMGYFQGGLSSNLEFTLNIFEILRKEFFFPLASFQTSMNAIRQGYVGVRIFTDLANAFFTWLPSSLKPSTLVGLEATNTIYHSGTTIYGGLPTDFVTTCFYELNLAGIFIIPFLFGYFVRKFENNIHPKLQNDYYKVIYILGIFYFVKAVGYGDPSNIMSNIFFLVWGHLFTLVICKMRIGIKVAYQKSN